MSIVEQLPVCVTPSETMGALSMEYCNYQSAGVVDLPLFDPEERVDSHGEDEEPNHQPALVPGPLQTGHTPVDDSSQQCLL